MSNLFQIGPCGSARIGILVCCFCALPIADVQGQPAVSEDVVRARQANQQRVRQMARELVSGVLDVQLRQLEDNGLTDEPIGRDVRLMRENIDALIAGEMREVVELLALAEQSQGSDRQAQFNQARDKVRAIVIDLTIQRQRLARRLKIAELVEQVRRLIALQTAVRKATDAISSQAARRQSEATLLALEDQRDVTVLYAGRKSGDELRGGLVQLLEEYSRWDGEIAAGALDGLRIIKIAAIDQQLASAEKNLQSASHSQATEDQTAVVQGLTALLDRLEKTLGLVGSDREQALDLIRDLSARQSKLKERTETTYLMQPEAHELVDAQGTIQKDLAKLNEAIAELPTAQGSLEQAKAAALQARTDLFESQQPEAIKQQRSVLSNLAQLEQHVLDASDVARSDRSADELARLADDLRALQKDLQPVIKEQERANETVQKDQAQAAAAEKNVAESLAKLGDNRQLPAVVKARLAAAESSAREAAEKSTPGKADAAEARNLVEQADEAVELAGAEVAAALADTERRQLAIEIGELARAAETLERAAAAERRVAALAGDAAEQSGLTAEVVEGLRDEQAEVNEVAKHVAEGIRNTAPQAAKTLDESKGPLDRALAELKKAATAPGEPSKPASAATAAEATAAANQLVTAARQIREQIAQAASELGRVAGRQLSEIGAAQAAVEPLTSKQSMSLHERLAQLDAAEDKTLEAAARQHQAAGRPKAANAVEMVRDLGRALSQQRQASRAADDLADGRTDGTFDSAASQDEVAKLAAELAKRAADEQRSVNLQKTLAEAKSAAETAAKESLAGNMLSGRAAAEQAEELLNKAQELARTEARTSQDSAASEPDAKAQGDATEAILEAQKMTAEVAPAAASTLAKASEAAAEAGESLAKDDGDAARAPQQQVTDALQLAEQQIDAARSDLTKESRRQQAKMASPAGNAAQQTAAVDPSATAALRAAEEVAAAMGQEQGDSAEAQADGHAALERDVARAEASLAAREERVARDKQLAEEVGELIKQQQQARDSIAQHAESLAGSATESSNRTAAARALSQAQDQFAEAQLATGEAAEEVSAQSEVANQPLRDALEIAENLGDLAAASSPLPPSTADQSLEPKSTLGSGFVSESPMETAQRIAGPEAQKELAALLGSEDEAATASIETTAQTSKQAAPDATAPATTSAQQTANSASGKGADAPPSAQDLKNQPWFARLPPDVQKAIRSSSERPAPRGYEERLRKYFENVD